MSKISKKPKPKSKLDPAKQKGINLKIKRVRKIDVKMTDRIRTVITSDGTFLLNRIPKDIQEGKFYTGGMSRISMVGKGLVQVNEATKNDRKEFISYLEEIENKQMQLRTKILSQIEKPTAKIQKSPAKLKKDETDESTVTFDKVKDITTET